MIKKILMITIIMLLTIIVTLLIIVIFILLSSSDRQILFQPSKKFIHNGITRTYQIREPSIINTDTAIVVGLHGFSNNAKIFAYYSGIQNALPPTDIILYPESVAPKVGQKSGWNAGFCCGSGWAQQADDAGYILALVEQTKRDFDIQDAKVFIVGFSNGAFMAQKLAAEFPDKVDGIVSASGAIGTESYSLKPTQPVPILLMHGEKDQRVTFAGGSSDNDPEFVWKSHTATREAWENNNGKSAETKVITYPDDAHKWHDWRLFNIWHRQPQASIEARLFIEQYR